ncbi:MAG: isoprenylcysteine carboxylmethyltransferase family protein [Syntrophomonadaceae bacterium]|nr:isoprenylcysteine carboxylmethyltransferase family protein [Syntrophomonadaceae bacterium]
MISRMRGVFIRMLIALIVFIYVGYVAWQQLPSFDFWVVMLFFIVYSVWSVVAETLIYKDPEAYVIEDQDKRSYLYLQLSFLVALFYAAIDFVELHYTRLFFLEPYVIYIGFILFIISCFIRWRGFESIDKYFNPRVAVYENHRLMTEGAYKNIRHPLYLGSAVGFFAIPMVFNSWGGLLIILLATVPALVYRIRIEEEFMLKHFGDEYAQYMKRTKKMIPGIW